MARNGSGTYSKVNTFVASNPITAAGHNANWDDLALEVTNSIAADGQTTISGALKGASGSVGAPGYAFSADLDCGMYRIGANNIGLAVNGAKVVDIGTAGISVVGTLTPSGVIVSSAGDASTPGYTFTGDLNTGFYHIGADNIGIAVGGTKIVDVASTGIGITGLANLTTTSANALTVGRQGATAPAFHVDASAGTSATGIKVTAAAAASGVALAAISSGANENLNIDAKGSGTVTINGTATGAVTITPATTVTGVLTANASAGIVAKNVAKVYATATYSAGTPTLVTDSSLGVSGITDTATGRIRFTFSNAFADANYAPFPVAESSSGVRQAYIEAKATTHVDVIVVNADGTNSDPTSVSVVVFNP